MIDPYCRKHGHWDCPKCGSEKEVDARELVERFAEAIRALQAVRDCKTCPACSAQAGAVLEKWKEGKDDNG